MSAVSVLKMEGEDAVEIEPLARDWWQDFNFGEGASFEVRAEGDWWQVNSRRWQGHDVLVRYVGGDPADDFWIRIDDENVRPSQVPAGTVHGQVGNLVKVMFLQSDGMGPARPAWYTGEIKAYSLRSPEEGKPKVWMYTIDFEDDGDQQYFQLPDADVRIHFQISDVLNALKSVSEQAQDEIQEYCDKREVHRSVTASLHAVVKSVCTECETRAKARVKEVESYQPNKQYNYMQTTETHAIREFMTLLREKFINNDMLHVREWNRMSKRICPAPRPLGPTPTANLSHASAAGSAAGRGGGLDTTSKSISGMPKDESNDVLKVKLKMSSSRSLLSRGALIEVLLGPEHGVSGGEDGDEEMWEIGRVVSVTENGKEVGVSVLTAIPNAVIDVSVDRVRPVGGGGGDVPVEYGETGVGAWIRSYKDGQYQLLMDGDDMSNDSVEGEWVDCCTSDIRVDAQLPMGRVSALKLRALKLLLYEALSC